MIDMSKPYILVQKADLVQIEVDESASEDDPQFEIQMQFVVNGCVELVETSTYVEGLKVTNTTEAFCNYLVPEDKEQTVFYLTVPKEATGVVLEAVVDQFMATSERPLIVSPSHLVDDPQTHFARLRLQEDYEFTHNGHSVKGSKFVRKDLTQFIEKVNKDGNYSFYETPANKTVDPSKITQLKATFNDLQG